MISKNASHKGGFSNTRPNLEKIVVVHLDYLRVKVSLKKNDLSEFLSFIDHKYCSVEMGRLWSPGSGVSYYENSISSPGIVGGFTICPDSGDTRAMVQFSGSWFAGRSFEDVWRLCRGLHYRFNAVCTRIDIAIDDINFNTIPVKEIEKAVREGNNFGFQKYSYAGTLLSDGTDNRTDYYGSRDSGKMVRIYNHENECQRFEVEYKRTYSRTIFLLLATLEKGSNADYYLSPEAKIDCMDAIQKCKKILGGDSIFSDEKKASELLHGCNGDWNLTLQKLFGSIAVSSIDFRDKSKLKSSSQSSFRDTKRLGFYQEFMDIIGSQVKVKILKVKSSMEQTSAWLKKQVSKSIAIIRDSLGAIDFQEYLSEMFNSGRDRYSYSDYKKIEFIRDNPRILGMKSLAKC